MSKFDWKRQPGHEDQTLLTWWVEQVASLLILWVGRRALSRGDSQTAVRIGHIIDAGARAERILPSVRGDR